jgi:integrase
MARGQVLKRKSGAYAIRYFDAAGRRHYETIGPDRRQAERALSARLRDLDTGRWREPSRETLTDYTRRWLSRRDPARTPAGREGRLGKSRLAPATHREYRRALELHILPRIGQRTLASLQPADIDQLIAELEEQGAAPGTIRNTITPLRKLLGDAVHLGLLTHNPAARPDLPPAPEFTGQELLPEHTTAIRNALAELSPPDPLRHGEPDRFYVQLYDVALGTGLRLGELRALRWCDVDRARHLLRVEQAYSRNDLKRPKSEAGIRSIPIFPSVQAALDALAARALERSTYAPAAQLIFQTERGTPLHPSNLNRRIWQPALRAAKLANPEGKPLYRFHDLRHTTISRLVAAGADIKLVQAIAGHSNPLITLKRYSHLLDHRLTHAASQYDPAQTGSIPKGAS